MASTNVGSIHYDLKIDTSQFDKASESINSKLQNVGNKMKRIGKTMTAAVTLPVVAGFGVAIKAASDLNETINKVDVSFKEQATSVKAWAKTSIQSMGLAQQSALDAAALFGDMSTSMGLNVKQAGKMSMNLVQLGADMASFKNVSFERAQTALAGVFTGETEALKGLGIVMTETNLQTFAQSQGIKGNIQDLTQAEKVQLRYAFVMAKTKNAQGDFARTSSSTSNQIRSTNERFKELSAQLGQQLLPIANQILGILSRMAERFSNLSPEVQKAILIGIGLAAVLGPLIMILTGVGKAIMAVRAALILLATHPIVAIVLGIIAVLIYLQMRFKIVQKVIRLVTLAFSSLAGIARSVTNIFKGIVRTITGFGKSFFNAGKSLLMALGRGIKKAAMFPVNAAKSAVKKIRDLLPFSDAKEGPLSDLTLSGKRFSETFAKGIMQGSNAIKNASTLAMSGATTNNNSTSIYGNVNIGSNIDQETFFRRLTRNQELSIKGISTRNGSV